MNNTLASKFAQSTSQKDQSYENFPVASWFLASSLRPHVNIFYNFARTADDIADTNSLNADEKLELLSHLKNALLGNNKTNQVLAKAHAMRESLEETGITTQHCLDLLRAFSQDAIKSRYENPEQLLEYCQLSAAPVGRYLLDLHGENSTNYISSDPLCNALQILNHLQDCREDYLVLDRVYLPMAWIREQKLDLECFAKSKSSTNFRLLINQTLNLTSKLLSTASDLPYELTNQRLAMESSVILHIAHKLENKIRSHDPLSARLKLTKIEYLSSFASGTFKTLVK